MGEVDGGEGGEGGERHRGAGQQVVRQVQVGEPATFHPYWSAETVFSTPEKNTV